MRPLDHLQQFALIFQRALADLPADKRAIYADLATPHGDALAKALTHPGPAADPAASTAAGGSPTVPGDDRAQVHG